MCHRSQRSYHRTCGLVFVCWGTHLKIEFGLVFVSGREMSELGKCLVEKRLVEKRLGIVCGRDFYCAISFPPMTLPHTCPHSSQHVQVTQVVFFNYSRHSLWHLLWHCYCVVLLSFIITEYYCNIYTANVWGATNKHAAWQCCTGKKASW